MRLHTIVAALTLACTGLASAAEWFGNEWGETAIVKMESAPFPHESRAEGFKGRNGTLWPAEVHYMNNEVGLYIPNTFKPGPTTDVIVYFHGHGNDVRKSLETFKIREQIVAANRNAILILPQGPYNASDSGLGKLEDPDGLKNLIAESLGVLNEDGKIPAAELGHVVLTGHSGAYKGIGMCLRQGGVDDHINEVYLLDASYGQLEDFSGWIEKHPEGRFGSIFTDHLAGENVIIMATLSKDKVPFVLRVDDNIEADAEKAPVFFVHTVSLDHNGTVSWLERFLKAGNE
ncbi:hypothetical protein GC173_17635 [bacterium]|nr:hypothetical protein [bacterium]